MSKRKKNDPNPGLEDDNDDDDNDSRNKQQQPAQKVYDFHKKTIEVYPERLRELNRQFCSSISSQITTEPYSVLVGNCLDYVRQYFNYEEDLLQYSPWLAKRLKQSRSDIVKCLQETIDVYEALARQDFDCLFTNEKSSTDESIKTKSNNSVPTTTTTTTPSFQFRSVSVTTTATTASSSAPLFSFSKPITTTTTANTTDSTPTTGFNFTIPTKSTSPEKTPNPPPFAFSLPNTGFGTSTFASPSIGTSTSSISFASPAKFSFTPITPTVNSEPQATTEDNDDEASEPPEPEKVEHEADAKLTYRCRMGVNKGGKLIKRGPVQVVLKETNQKHQLIVRSDDTLGRLYLNIIWSKTIELKKNSTKDLTFVCKLNPGMTEIKEGEFVMILFRFDNETDRNDAYDKLDKERS